MDPTSTLKSAFNVSFILKLILGLIILNVIAEIAGISAWIYSPLQMAKNKFSPTP